MTRLYSLILFILVLLSCIGTPAAAELLPGHDSGLMATHLGDNEWLTGDNDFEQIVAKATHEQKLILLVFCPNDHEMCSSARRNLFGEPEFSKVTERVVPVLISSDAEQTHSWFDRFELPVFPTCLLLSPDGQILGEKPPIDKLDEYLQWMMKMENVLVLDSIVADHPKNNAARKQLLKSLKNFHGSNAGLEVFHDRIIDTNPDPFDEITHELYELKTKTLLRELYPGNKDLGEEDLRELGSKIFPIYDYYYPDKFRYDLKGAWAFTKLMEWYQWNKQPDMVDQVFVDGEFLLVEPNDHMQLFDKYLSVLLRNGDLERVEEIVKLIHATFHQNRHLWKNRDFPESYIRCLPDIPKYLAPLDHVRAEHFICSFYEYIYELVQEVDVSSNISSAFALDLLIEHDILISDTLTLYEHLMEKLTGYNYINLILGRTRLISSVHGPEQAREFLLGFSSDDRIVKAKTQYERQGPNLLSQIIWALTKTGVPHEDTLQMATDLFYRISVDIHPYVMTSLLNAMSLLHKNYGNVYHALAYMKESLQMHDSQPISKKFHDSWRQSLLENYTDLMSDFEQSGLPIIKDLEIDLNDSQ